MSGLVAFGADTDKKEKRARAKVLEKYDTNKDGKLDKSERQAMHKDRRADRHKNDGNTPSDPNKSGDQPKKEK